MPAPAVLPPDPRRRRRRVRTTALAVAALAAVPLGFGAVPAIAADTPAADGGLTVTVSAPETLLDAPTEGRIMVVFSPPDQNPLANIDALGPDSFYGQNVSGFDGGDSVTLQGGDGTHVDTAVYGYPHQGLDDLPAGDYHVQAFLTKYETVTRSDGSTVSLRFPCGEGGPSLAGAGSLISDIGTVTITGGAQHLDLALSSTVPGVATADAEIGGCSQGDYADPTGDQPGAGFLQHMKIRSTALSDFWGRDMYVGANVVLPAGYDPADTTTRYPVVYVQAHWPGPGGGFGYPYWTDFTQVWNAGQRTDASGQTVPIPKFIMVMVRNESPYYDDSYNVNSPNAGPWGDAINDELVPAIDARYNTIAQPYARIQDGCSTGGWIAVSSTIFRPDLYGAAFGYCPDSLDFDQHQAIPLYTAANAYVDDNGTPRGSIRNFDGGTENVLLTTEQENHWELSLGTSTRSFLQWDVWNATFGVQGLNGYPLEPWNKVTGEIYPGAVDYWRSMDMSRYVAANWTGTRNLGEALRDRLHISVGDQDNYYLNGGTEGFKQTVEALGGPDWADITIVPNLGHGGFYDNLDIWSYLDVIQKWIDDHAPDGATPLTAADTAPTTRGNEWADVIATGGHQAALDRQADPAVVGATSVAAGDPVQVDAGSWDPGVELRGQWLVDGQPDGESFALAQGAESSRTAPSAAAASTVALAVTGEKTGYATETRTSPAIAVAAEPAGPTTSPTGSPTASPTGAPTAAPTAAPTSAPTAGGGLAHTGVDTSWVLAAVAAAGAAVAGGILLVARRRRARSGVADAD